MGTSEDVEKAWAYLLRLFVQTDDQKRQAAREALSKGLKLLESSLRKAEVRSREMWALCPYHQDTHVGSFSFNLSTGKYFCFVCGARGGLPTLLRQVCEDTHEVRELLTSLDPESLELLEGIDREAREEIEAMVALPEGIAAALCRHAPLMYLERHPERLVREFEVGYDEAELRACFMVRDATQRLVGIQSRSIDPHARLRWKWYNRSFERFLGDAWFDEPFVGYSPPRSTVLYNEHRVFRALTTSRENASIVINEGPGHVMRSTEAGFLALGSFGTQLGPGQRIRLSGILRHRAARGCKDRVYVAHDGDDAGVTATCKTALTLQGSWETYLPEMAEGMDPEDHSPSGLREVYSRARLLEDHLHSPGRMGDTLRHEFARAMQEKERLEDLRRKRSDRGRSLTAIPLSRFKKSGSVHKDLAPRTTPRAFATEDELKTWFHAINKDE